MVSVTCAIADGNGQAVAGADVVLVGEGLADDGAVVVRQAAQDGVAILARQEAQAAVAAHDVDDCRRREWRARRGSGSRGRGRRSTAATPGADDRIGGDFGWQGRDSRPREEGPAGRT